MQRDAHLGYAEELEIAAADLSEDRLIGDVDGAALTLQDMQLPAEGINNRASGPRNWRGSIDVETVPDDSSAQSAVVRLQEVSGSNQADCAQKASEPGRIASMIGHFRSRFTLAEFQLAYAGHQVKKCRNQAAN